MVPEATRGIDFNVGTGARDRRKGRNKKRVTKSIIDFVIYSIINTQTTDRGGSFHIRGSPVVRNKTTEYLEITGLVSDRVTPVSHKHLKYFPTL